MTLSRARAASAVFFFSFTSVLSSFGCSDAPASVDDAATTDDASTADETAEVIDANACGVCAPPHATGVCKNGACAIAKCNGGYADCDKAVKDGCEVVLASDVNACGACGNVCKKPTNGTVACNAGKCETACNPGYAACTSGCCVTPPALGKMDSGDRFNCAITSATDPLAELQHPRRSCLAV